MIPKKAAQVRAVQQAAAPVAPTGIPPAQLSVPGQVPQGMIAQPGSSSSHGQR